MINIVLFGPPGAGKGTQSKYLIEKYNLVYISTGDMLRKELKSESELGKKVQKVVNSGGLVSDEIIVQLIEKVIRENENSSGFLFDGFPRTYVQAYILDGLLHKLHVDITCMLMLDVSEEILMERLLNRGENRADDTKEVIQNRLKEYKSKTLPVIDYYKEKGIFYKVDGIGEIEDIHEKVVENVEKAISKTLLNIIVYGYPGAGKGTQAKLIAKKYDLVYISLGRILRTERDKDSNLGDKTKEYLDKGLLVPDEIVIQLLEKETKLNPDAKGFVFKGFPRTLIQTYIMDGFLEKIKTTISAIINIDTSSLACIRRLSKRGGTDKSRPYDKNIDLILARLEEYEQKTLPVVEAIKDKKKIICIDGTREREEVFADIEIELKKTYNSIH